MGKSTFNNPLTTNMLDDMYRSIVESTSDSIYIVDQECRYCFINQSHLSRLGVSSGEMIGKAYSDFHSPQPSREFRKKINQVFATGKSVLHEYKSPRDNRYFLRTMSPLKEQKSGGKIIGVVVLSKDINKQKQKEEALRESEEKYKNIIENIDDGYLEIDPEWNTLFCNTVWLDIIGYSQKEFAEMSLSDIMDGEAEKHLSQVLEEVYQTGKPSRGVEFLIRHKNGEKINVEISSSLIENSKGKCSGFRNFIRNVTEQKRAVETIRRLAYHDPLTDLPNRLLFKDRLNMAIMRAKRNRQYLAVMMLDLDKFKDVNDTLGHHMGDRLLQDVGNRLVLSLRKGDTVARMGGDEFLILLPDIKHIESSTMIAQKVVDAFQDPFIVDGHDIHITTSIGIATYPANSEDADTLVKNADIAMYRAKDFGRNNYQQFSPTMIT
jgi:diguanylate cyclase (GGDEF)-like protein/PAS domain S-box-containing protein